MSGWGFKKPRAINCSCTTTMTNVLIHYNLSIPNDGYYKMLAHTDYKTLWCKIKDEKCSMATVK